MKAIKLASMTGSFSAYNAGEQSNAELAHQLVLLWNASVTLNPEVEDEIEIMAEVFTHFIRGVEGGQLFPSVVHKATHGINYHRIGEALLDSEHFERDLIVTAARKAHKNEFDEDLNSGVFGRMGKNGKKKKSKPNFKKVKTAIERQTKTVASLKGSKDKAEALAAAKLLVAALSV